MSAGPIQAIRPSARRNKAAQGTVEANEYSAFLASNRPKRADNA